LPHGVRAGIVAAPEPQLHLDVPDPVGCLASQDQYAETHAGWHPWPFRAFLLRVDQRRRDRTGTRLDDRRGCRSVLRLDYLCGAARARGRGRARYWRCACVGPHRLAFRPLRPVIKVAERLEINRIEFVELRFELGTWITKHGKRLALDHRAKPHRKPFREYLQVRNGSGRIGISFVEIDNRPVFAPKPVVATNAAVTSSRS